MNIQIFDTTLRDGEQAPGNTMNPDQKLAVALALEELGVNVIEAGFPVSSPEDFLACKLIGEKIKKAIVCGFSRCKEEDVIAVTRSLEHAQNPAIHLFIPCSNLHIEKKLGTTKESVLDLVSKTLGNVTSSFKIIYFGLEDATRSDKLFLNEMVARISQFRVDCITLADTVGYSQPSEIYNLVRDLRTKFPGQRFGIHCHNDLGLATANTLAAISAGIHQIQVTINGIGERAGNTSLEEIVATLISRSDYYNDVSLDIDIQKIKSTSDLVYKTIGRRASFEKPIVGVNAFKHEAGIHVDGIIKDPKTYELLNPESFGYKREIVEGRHSGKKSKYNQSNI